MDYWVDSVIYHSNNWAQGCSIVLVHFALLWSFLPFYAWHVSKLKDWLIRIVIVVNNYYVITVFCLCRNEIIPRLKEYNIFFEGRKALQLTSKEVWCVFFLIVPGGSVADNKIITYRVVIIFLEGIHSCNSPSLLCWPIKTSSALISDQIQIADL